MEEKMCSLANECDFREVKPINVRAALSAHSGEGKESILCQFTQF